MDNPLVRLVAAGAIAALALVAIKKGMDWRAADTAPLMYLTVDHLPSADCEAFSKNLAGQPEPGDACRFTGYVYSRTNGCAGNKDAWGVSQERHGKGAFVLFCLPQPGVAPASTTKGVVQSYEAAPIAANRP